MKALNSTALFIFTVAVFATGLDAHARHVNPAGLVAESSLAVVDDSKPNDNQWQGIKKSVSSWFDKAKNSLLGKDDSKKVAESSVLKRVVKPDPVKELTAQLPNYKTAEKMLDKNAMIQAKQQLLQGITKVATPGRSADASLPTNKLGIPQVPTTDSQQVKGSSGKTKTITVARKKIPLLNVGLEDTLELNEFLLANLRLAKVPEKQAKPLATPDLMSKKQLEEVLKKFPVAKVEESKNPRKDAQLKSELVTQKMIDAITVAMLADKPVTERAYRNFSASDIKMLAAVILYRIGDNCEAVMGLFYELEKEQDKKKESEFHIGACAQKLKLYTTGYKYLAGLIKEENPEYAERSLKLLADDLPRDYEAKFAKLILGLKNKSIITQKVQDAVYYRVAKGAYDSKQFKSAKSFAEKVSENSKFGLDALYVSAIADYSLGRSKSAEKSLKQLLKVAAVNKVENKNILSLAAVNLARIKFTQENFKESLGYFKMVDKNHSLWVRALVEQGWAQLMMGDAAGAIGNMYSLHSPYFTSVYKPESYVVRTIGYLNICQYGDAYKTLSLLEKDYRPWQDAVSSYIAKNKASSTYYWTVKKYLTGKSSQDVDGLPFQVIREMARQKAYLNAQTSINEKFDERIRYRSVVAEINKKKASYRWRKNKAKERLNEAKALLQKSKTDNSLAPRVNQLNAQVRNETAIIAGYNYLLDLMDDSKKSYSQLQSRGHKVLVKNKKSLEGKAGTALVSHLKDMQVDMARMLSNNEFLRYEVFAGSGQNIRYQVAGGSTEANQRIPASIKPEKSLNWSFSGEYWEDEIGSYRSSLKNNCPQTGHYESLKKEKNNI